MTEPENLPNYDRDLPGAHLYLGLTNEHELDATSSSLFQLFPSDSILKYPLIASNFCLFPGETLPLITDETNIMEILEEVRSTTDRLIFHLPRQSDDDPNRYGVLMQLTHYKVEDGNLFAKIKAVQMVYFFQELWLHTYNIFEKFIVLKKAAAKAIIEEIHNFTYLASDPQWVHRQQLTMQVSKNTLRHYSQWSWDNIKSRILEYYKKLQMDEDYAEMRLNDDPASVSYFLLNNIPMTLAEKISLLNDNIEHRIYACLDMIKRFKHITCTRCNGIVASPDDFVFISNNGVCQLFVNPSGYFFNAITVRSNKAYFGTPDATWYPTYNWSYIICRCMNHHGWGFASTTCKPEGFAAIILSSAEIRRFPVVTDSSNHSITAESDEKEEDERRRCWRLTLNGETLE